MHLITSYRGRAVFHYERAGSTGVKQHLRFLASEWGNRPIPIPIALSSATQALVTPLVLLLSMGGGNCFFTIKRYVRYAIYVWSFAPKFNNKKQNLHHHTGDNLIHYFRTDFMYTKHK